MVLIWTVLIEAMVSSKRFLTRSSCYRYHRQQHMIGTHVSRNGTVIPAVEARMGIDHLELTHGFGVHETLRCIDGRVYFVDDHAERLCASARCIGLGHPFTEQHIVQWLLSFAQHVDHSTFLLKVRLVGAAHKEDAQLFIYAVDLPCMDEEVYRLGVSLIAREGERIYPTAKTFCMLQSYIVYREAKLKHAQDCLLINRRGEITEGTRTNFFAVKNGELYSAPSEDILSGITRKQVLATAKRMGMSVREEPIHLEALSTYDGFFITSTSINMLPVTRIDELIKPVPEVVEHLRNAYDAYLSAL